MATITELNENDVLLGRGSGARQFVGSVRFRDIVKERRAEYVASVDNRTKEKIAKEVFNRIRENGGRFLALVDGTRPTEGSIVDSGEWYEVPRDVAVEKVKMALRQNQKKKPNERSSKRNEEGMASGENRESMAAPHHYSREGVASLGQPYAPPASMPMLSSRVASGPFGSPGAPVDPRLLLFQQYPFEFQQQQLLAPSMITNPMNQSLLASMNLSHLSQQPILGNSWLNQAGPTAPAYMQVTRNVTSADQSRAQLLEMARSSLEEDSAHVLSSLAVAGQPKFTEEEEAQERDSLTDEEKVAVLTDKFGKMSAIAPRQRKRARRDLDRSSIDFLIQQMRLEIENIPDHDKTALLEAQAKCRVEEFSDARLEKFLRCTGMNPKLAAQRFVNYWQSRYEVFGEDKYLLPMTLSEAMRDDLTALETGFYCLLPRKDLSGRQIIYLEPKRHTGEGYTPESLIRAIWYNIEVCASQNTDISSGYIVACWDRGSTYSNFDYKVFSSLMRFEMNAWPVRLVSSHICCTPNLVLRVVKPILFALTDKRTRTRTNMHDVPESDLLGVLSQFGIMNDMLPTEMGGTIELDFSEWIANRRATEMEEI